MKIILLGPPSSGKGTQAQFITEKFDIPHISTGDILRQNIREGSELGLNAKAYMEKGDLVPDSLINDMMAKRLAESDCEAGFLLDGFPRTVEQANKLDEVLGSRRLDAVIVIDVDSDELVARAVGRRVCPKCSASFHIKNKPSQKGEFCDNCGDKLVQREDDVESTVRNRLEVYDKRTSVLIKYYEDRGIVHKVNGNASPVEVSTEIISRLNDIH
ncbi:MAG: adenylate kinase [Bacillota bacterium]|nr:adenylate kinase [Bacillota bacterium]